MSRDVDELRERLRWDFPFYAEHCLKIIDTGTHKVPFVLKEPQARLDGLLEAQRRAGRPQRAIVLKARKIGFSTYAQGKGIHRATQRENHNALTVAHDSKTGSALFSIGEVMHANLPPDATLGVKPTIRNSRRGMELVFGEPSIAMRREGVLGINSNYRVDTAREVEAGRGFTFHTLHLSEVAFWPDIKKMTALLNAVPDDPNTLIIKESTANGHNFFRKDWLAAIEGRSEYIPFFSAWHEEPLYVRPFATNEEREDFIASIGEGAEGEDEPSLMEDHGCSPEQLHWRRWAIAAKCADDVQTFHQEYPSTWDEAFLASGQGVFSGVRVARVLKAVDEWDPARPTVGTPGPARGLLTPAAVITRRLRHGTAEVPTGALWVPRSATALEDRKTAFWKVWQHPFRPAELEDDDDRKWVETEKGRELAKPGAYVLGMDPMSGELSADGSLAFHAITVIDHRTLKQVASWRSRVDADLAAMEFFLAALYWNSGWVAPETTGGYGLSVKNALTNVFRYPWIYRRPQLESRKEKTLDRLGWDTNQATKVLLRDTGRERLRQDDSGIRDRELALEHATYRQNERGKMEPEDDAHADLLLSWLIAQQVATELHIREPRKTGAVSATTRAIVNRKAGY